MIVTVMAPVLNRIGDASPWPPCPLIGQLTPVQLSDWRMQAALTPDVSVTMMWQTGTLCDSRSLDADYNIRGTIWIL